MPLGVAPAENRRYHDDEWGRPIGDDRRIFEKLCLEGFQSGLSWLTILRKREGFRTAFASFDPVAVAAFGEKDVERLLSDISIVRHRGKIEATIANARALLALWAAGQSLAALLWSYEAPCVGPGHDGGRARVHGPVAGAVGLSAPPWLPLRRPHDRLCGDAVPRRRQRPPVRLPFPRPSPRRSGPGSCRPALTRAAA